MSDQQPAIIQVKDLTVSYQRDAVLQHIDLDLVKNSRTAIIGPNGAGKSTLIKAILELIPTNRGNVLISGRPYKEIYQNIAYVPQSSSVQWDFPTTVLDVVLMGRYVHKGWIKRTNKADKDLALKALERIGMINFKDRQISQLSGGQRQRVFLARAICQDADIYFLDEPLQGVDIRTEALIMSVLKDFQKQGKTVIVVHHDLNTVAEYFDHVVMLNRQIIADGPVSSTFTEANIDGTYRYRGSDVSWS